MKYFFIGSIIGLFVIVVISYGIQRHQCTLPAATWIDENHNGIQEPFEVIMPLGYCAYKKSVNVGWPSFATVSYSPRDQGVAPIVIEWDSFLLLGLNILWCGVFGGLVYVVQRQINRSMRAKS